MTGLIAISPAGKESKRLWDKALELSCAFGAAERWVLVGGLMVQLHAFERNAGSRLTGDVDFLGDSQRRPSMTSLMAEVLIERGADMAVPPVSSEGLGYQFEVDGETIEILGSEGVRRDPKTLGRYRTIQVPGGRQALARAEVVSVSLDGADPTAIRRPSLLGAILIKARAVEKQRDKLQSDRQDLILLLSFVEDARLLAESGRVKKTEQRWLRRIEALLAFDDGALASAFDPAALIRAEQAYRLLLAVDPIPAGSRRSV